MRRWIRNVVAALWVVGLPTVAFAQDGTTEDQVGGITAAVVAVIGFIATLVARWSKTNPANPWYRRLATVFDVTQVFDSTRPLDE